MMRLDEATLNAYLDGELSRSEQQAVEACLAESAEARAMLARLKEDTVLVNHAFKTLGPPVEALSPGQVALRRLYRQFTPPPQETGLNRKTSVKESAMVWESPALLTELKIWFRQLTHFWKQPAAMTLLATIALLVVVGLGLAWWPGLGVIQPDRPASAFLTQTCPVTLPPAQPFIPPEPYPPEPPGPSFWYGDEALWTALPVTGVWTGLPHNPDGYTQKLLWWRVGYSWTEEPQPALQVTGYRLDDPHITLLALPATNAFAPDIQSAMLTGVDFPTPGCWQITGRYAEAELSYIVQVDP